MIDLHLDYGFPADRPRLIIVNRVNPFQKKSHSLPKGACSPIGNASDLPIPYPIDLSILEHSSHVFAIIPWPLPSTRSTRSSRNKLSSSTNFESRILTLSPLKDHASGWVKSRRNSRRSSQQGRTQRKKSVCYSKRPRYARPSHPSRPPFQSAS